MPLPRPVFLALLLLTLLRAVLAGTHELTPAEAHLWLCSERMAPSYVDFGPLTPLLVKLGVLAGGKTSFAVRWLAPGLALMASLIIYRLATSLFDQKTGIWSVVVVNLTPLFNAAGILILPATVGFLAWIAALWAVWRALHRAGAWNRYWPLAGLCMGVGILASTANAVQPLCLVLLLAISRRWRRQLLRPGAGLAIAISAVMAVPLFWWHAQNDWLVWQYQIHDLTHGASFGRLMSWLGEVAIGLSPILCAGMLWALALTVRQLWRARLPHSKWPEPSYEATLFLLAFSLPMLAVSAWLSLFAGGALGASAPALFGLELLLVARWLKVDFSPGTVRLAQNATLCVAAAYSIVLAQSDLLRHWGFWPYRLDPSTHARGWRTSASAVSEALDALSKESPEAAFVIADSAALAASLNFHWPTSFPKRNTPLSPLVQTVASPIPSSDFAFWPRYDFLPGAAGPSLSGRSALFVTADKALPLPPAAVRNSFQHVDRLGAIEVMRGSHVVRSLALFACYDYRGPSF
ncbi:MAG: ArnT family glycosyltransferase [Verrucomicrobiales bacterium]